VPLGSPLPSVFFLWCLGCLILLLDVFFNLKCLNLYIVLKLDYMFIVKFAFLSNYGFEGSFGTYCYSITGLPCPVFIYMLFTFLVIKKNSLNFKFHLCP
jgi:hypothetical protein